MSPLAVGEAPSVKLGPEEADCLRLIALFGGRLRRNPIRIAKDNNSADVRYWHIADMPLGLTNVCFWGQMLLPFWAASIAFSLGQRSTPVIIGALVPLLVGAFLSYKAFTID